MALMFCSCSSSSNEDIKKEKVALLLPSGTMVSRWAVDANYLKNALLRYGFDVNLYQAEESANGAKEQVKQIKEAIDAGCGTLVITPIDYSVINEDGILEANQNCNIICYDRMIMENPAIDFYTTCDPSKIGEMQAQFLLNVAENNNMEIEYFAGPKTDKNALTYFESAYGLLGANESFTVPSGKKSYSEVALASWSAEDAKNAMAERLNGKSSLPDLILAPNDNVASGIIEAIEESKLFTGTYPVITGQDMSDEAKNNIKAGKQAMTIYKEYEDLAETTAMVVSCFISGKPVITSNTFDNGRVKVPAKYTSFTLVTVHNIGQY